MARVALPLADPDVLVGLLWVVLCGLVVVLTLGLGIIVVWLPLGVVTIWLVYRIARGWIRLAARQPMYAEPPMS